MQLTVPAAAYAAGSQELEFFTQLNVFRALHGLGLVAQSVALDKANQNHLAYMLTNSDVNYSDVDPKTGVPYAHEEDPARPGYTGVAPIDRARFAGYAVTWTGEEVSYGLGRGGANAFASLLGTVYHRQGLMFQAPHDFGISAGNDKYQTTTLSFGIADKRQRNASDYFGAYPADKQTGVPLSMVAEVPTPFADVVGNDFAIKTSYPIDVASEESTTLKVESFTMTEAGQTVALDARLLTADNDPSKLLGKNTAYLVGKAPFKANTTYNVSFKGTVNGVAVTKTWSFATGQ
ncbi:hypothetical protein AB595_00950 [Massilia sp. WF1]|uniref:CAP domain-containing protein n=1 Tax=unclassified Massilia TaxID=2609279 RepID=UPI0006A182F3|nr:MULTISPECIES: CAP domain-containing protein [unclassified Massilia]KLU38465.2 hypothetical protein AB595_00950 [Massilia sp. WF1]